SGGTGFVELSVACGFVQRARTGDDDLPHEPVAVVARPRKLLCYAECEWINSARKSVTEVCVSPSHFHTRFDSFTARLAKNQRRQSNPLLRRLLVLRFPRGRHKLGAASCRGVGSERLGYGVGPLYWKIAAPAFFAEEACVRISGVPLVSGGR